MESVMPADVLQLTAIHKPHLTAATARQLTDLEETGIHVEVANWSET